MNASCNWKEYWKNLVMQNDPIVKDILSLETEEERLKMQNWDNVVRYLSYLKKQLGICKEIDIQVNNIFMDIEKLKDDYIKKYKQS